MERWRDHYERLLLPYALAYAIATVGVAVGFMYPLVIQGRAVTVGALALRWLGIVAALFVSSGVVWWFVVEALRERLVLGAVGIALATVVETVGGGWLVLRYPLVTSPLVLVATVLTALSLLAVAASLTIVTYDRFTYGRGILRWHWVLALAVPVALVIADRALPFEPDPVIGLIFVVVPFIVLLELANGELVRLWFEHDPSARATAQGL